MKNLKISHKLLVSFLIVALLAAAVGAVGIYATTSLTSSGELLNTRATIGIESAELLATAYEQRSTTRGIAVYTALFELDKAAAQRADLDKFIEQGTELLASIKEQAKTDATKKLIADIESQRADYADARDKFLAAVEAASKLESDVIVGKGNGVESAISVALADFGPHITTYATVIQTLSDEMNRLTDEQYSDMVALSSRVILILIIVLAVAVIAAVSIALYLTRLIVPTLVYTANITEVIGKQGVVVFPEAAWTEYQKLVDANGDESSRTLSALGILVRRLEYLGVAFDGIAKGDLTLEVATQGADDLLGNSAKAMIDSLNNAFGEINASTSQVATGSKQIADGAQLLAEGSTQQAAAVEELSSSISEVANSINEDAASATNASQLADSIKAKALQGADQMNHMMDAVREISEASHSISKVIAVIDNIAFQTNILALNAAVEAARAGQHGKGFAVVADEVRALAAKSAEAAKDTGGLIQNSIAKADLGARIANETNKSLQEIVDGITQTADIVTEIATNSQSLATAIEQINIGIDQVAQVVQQNSATAEESAAASEEMSGQSSVLQDLVMQFKLKD